MNIIQDLSERVLTEDHLPYEAWEKRQVDQLESEEVCTSHELETLRAKPEVWRCLRALVRLPQTEYLSDIDLEDLANILSVDTEV